VLYATPKVDKISTSLNITKHEAEEKCVQPPSNYQFGHPSEMVRNIALDLVLAIFTIGLWNVYVQYRQMIAINGLVRQEKYKFLPWICFTLVTCGLYHIYHQYMKSTDIYQTTRLGTEAEPLIAVVLSIFGLSIVADALQQSHLNRFCGGGDVL